MRKATCERRRLREEVRWAPLAVRVVGIVGAQRTMQINLERPQALLQRILQRAIDLVAFGLTAGTTVPEGEVRMPGPVLHFATAQNFAMSFAQAKDEFAIWILQAGFRDAVEAIQEFLEEVRVACAALSLGPKFTIPPGWTPPSRESPEGQTFHWYGIEKKLVRLEEQYGVAPGPDLRVAIEEINRARHCLVHRGGVVGEPDMNRPNGMRVSWRRLEFVVTDVATGVERPLVPPQVIETESFAGVRIAPYERFFRQGERLSVTADDFIGVCFTLLSAGQEFSTSVFQYAQRMGIPPADLGGIDVKASGDP